MWKNGTESGAIKETLVRIESLLNLSLDFVSPTPQSFLNGVTQLGLRNSIGNRQKARMRARPRLLATVLVLLFRNTGSFLAGRFLDGFRYNCENGKSWNWCCKLICSNVFLSRNKHKLLILLFYPIKMRRLPRWSEVAPATDWRRPGGYDPRPGGRMQRPGTRLRDRLSKGAGK